jgi:dTDP-4-amino-4,6-dideoxygalactose transaminase
MFSAVFDQRSSLMRKLHTLGIHAATPHNRNDRLSCFATRSVSQDLPGTTTFSESYICLPIGPWVTEEDCEAICTAIRSGW